ncbi:unnamed protein product, partial [Thelazia callipaeda]|uniref:Exocyst complex component Sec6 n=1 Tax=Thelazia callipaeda TaxID=103827 RepID=A0A0N5CNB6_THECL
NVTKKVKDAIHDAVNALRDIPKVHANITSLTSEENAFEGIEIELEDEEPAEAAWKKIEIMKARFNNMLRTITDILCNEIYNDLWSCFDQLLSKQMKNSNIIDTICETIRDYEVDYKHLTRTIHEEVLRCIKFKINLYNEIFLHKVNTTKILKMTMELELSRTVTQYRKRCIIAKCLHNDATAINLTFHSIFEKLNPNCETKNLTNLLCSIAEFIALRDRDMLSLEIVSILRKYPEMTQEFLFALIDIRDDVTSSESRALTEDCLKMVDNKKCDPTLTRLFQVTKGERKTSQIIRDVVPRLRRRVRASIAEQ